jgi:hypothetical protein
VFAGLANRYNSHTRHKLPRTKVMSRMLMLVAHNLRTLARVCAMEELKILLSYGFIRQTPLYSCRDQP